MNPSRAPWSSGPAAPVSAFQDDPDRWPSLVRRVGQGDADAEAALAREFYTRVLTAASVRLRGSDAAQDVAQDTIAAALQALRAGALREPAKLPGFVLGIARNLINNYCRLEARRRGLVTAAEELPEMAAPADAEGGSASEEDRRALVRESLKRLKPIDRRILLLTLVEGMNPREIGPLVGLTPAQVRTRKTRAVKAVAGHVEKRTRKRWRDHLQTSGSRT